MFISRAWGARAVRRARIERAGSGDLRLRPLPPALGSLNETTVTGTAQGAGARSGRETPRSGLVLPGRGLRAQRVEEPDGRRGRLMTPQGQRAVESAGHGQAGVQRLGPGDELLALRFEQRLRVRPGAVQQG